MSSFKLEVKKHNKEVRLVFSGSLNEQATLEDFDFATAESILIDLKDIQAINSVGVRTWLGFARKLPKDKKVIFQNLPKVWVDQCNMIKNFIPENLQIESLEIPYFCETCEKTTKVNTAASQIEKVSPVMDCASCKKSAILDILPEQYFKFLKSRA